MVKEMEQVKNTIIQENYYLKVNINMEENGMENSIMEMTYMN